MSDTQLFKAMEICQIKKEPSKGPFVLKSVSFAEPGLDGVGTVFRFPLFQCLVIAAFGFDDSASVRVFVDLYLARLKVAALESTA